MSDDASGFTPDEERMLTSLLDAIIPGTADGRLPGAGSLGLVRHIARMVEGTPMLRPVVAYGLSTLDDLARKRAPAGWQALSADDRTAVLKQFTAEDQFFLPAFLFLAYSGYYTDPRIVEALGLEPRPPHPAGYAMEADDLSILDPVRRRGKMYRDG
jgi:gluconate 2-dehydrogenase subunit 3-like protein